MSNNLNSIIMIRKCSKNNVNYMAFEDGKTIMIVIAPKNKKLGYMFKSNIPFSLNIDFVENSSREDFIDLCKSLFHSFISKVEYGI